MVQVGTGSKRSASEFGSFVASDYKNLREKMRASSEYYLAPQSCHTCLQDLELRTLLSAAKVQKAQKPIIQTVIRSKMAIAPFLFGTSALISQDYLLEKPDRTC